MGDTISIRVNEETRGLFKEILERGNFENQGDFLNRLLALYQADATKKTVSMLRPAIESVEALTSRLFEILNGAGATIATYEEKQAKELDEQRSSFEETRVLLQQRISSLEQEQSASEEHIQLLVSDKGTADTKLDELQRQINRLENVIGDKSALIEEYKEKNDALNGIVSEYKEADTEIKELAITVSNLKQENTRLHAEITGFDNEKEQIINGMAIEKENALLALKQEYQKKYEEQLSKNSAMIAEYEDRVRELFGLSASEKTTAAKTLSPTKPAGKQKSVSNKKTG